MQPRSLSGLEYLGSNRCLSLGLKREKGRKTTCADEERASDIYGHYCFEVRVQCNHGSLHGRERS
jgi:hypothetical protein